MSKDNSKQGLGVGFYHFMAPEDFEENREFGAIDICTALQEHTTCTGLPHIYHSRGIIKKIWWILITLAAISGLIYNLYQVGTAYANYDFNVLIKVTTENQLPFPSVTVCNMCPVKKSKLMEYLFNNSKSDGSFYFQPKTFKRKKRDTSNVVYVTTTPQPVPINNNNNNNNSGCCCTCCFDAKGSPDDSSSCRCQADQYSYDLNKCSATTFIPPTTKLTTTDIATTTTTSNFPSDFPSTDYCREITGATDTSTTGTQIISTASTIALTTETPKSLIDQALEDYDLQEILAAMNDTTKKMMGFQFEELILDCTFKGYDCLPDGNFESFYNEIHGNCYTFNAGRKNEDSVISQKTGRRHGLQMILNVNQPEYVTKGNDMAGIRVVVHQHRTMPFPENEGVAINPGQTTSLGLKQINLQRLSQPYDDCIQAEVASQDIDVYQELVPGVIYTTTSCYRTCYQRNVISQCGCGDSAYPLKGRAIRADGDVANTTYPPCSKNNVIQSQCMQNVSEMYNAGLIECDCFEPCNQTTYTVTLSLGDWPSEVQKETLLEKLQEKVEYDAAETYKENLAKVELYYVEFNYEMIQEVPAYELRQLLSDCGGILGLWLGMSVLTLCEFLEFGLDMCFYGCSVLYNFKKKKTSKVEDISIKPEVVTNEKWMMKNLEPSTSATVRRRESFTNSPFHIQ